MVSVFSSTIMEDLLAFPVFGAIKYFSLSHPLQSSLEGFYQLGQETELPRNIHSVLSLPRNIAN